MAGTRSSSVYLTRGNYGGPQLLRSIKGRPEPATEDPTPAVSQVSKMKQRVREKSVDTDAEPQSSSEDEAVVAPSSRSVPTTRPEMRQMSPPSKRKADISTSGRTQGKRRRLQDEPVFGLAVDVDEKKAKADEFFDALISSSSQTHRKSQKTYGSKYKRKNTDTWSSVETADKSEPTPSLKTYDIPDLLSPPKPAGASNQSLQIKDTIPLSLNVNGSKTGEVGSKILKPSSEPSVKSQASGEVSTTFYVPPLLEHDLVSTSNSTVSTTPAVFDSIDLSPTRNPRSRSASTSSLSSVNSMASLDLDSVQKARLNGNDTDLASPSRRKIKCPLCRQLLEPALVDYITPQQLTGLTLKKQQKFCLEHQRKDAQRQWTERGYPKLDWHNIKTNKVATYTEDLCQILTRQKLSTYLEELDAKIKAAKRNPRILRTYLKEGVVDTIRHGYFGPRGANIMATAITHALRSELSRAMDSDATVAKVGVGTVVGIVLVPEFMIRLVMEDMHVSDLQDARNILASSSDLGLVINADDDHVERPIEVD